jgi:hypothetical protein
MGGIMIQIRYETNSEKCIKANAEFRKKPVYPTRKEQKKLKVALEKLKQEKIDFGSML